MTTKYENPPINELVIGIYLREPVIAFRAEHVGLFWNRIRKDYPKSAQNMLLGNVDLQVPDEVFPLPRFWFISADEVYLIQVQRNAFLLNWRKREGAYPHYDALKKRFDILYGLFAEFLQDEFSVAEPAIERCELNYINLIDDQPYFQSFSDVSHVLPSFTSPLPNETGHFPAHFNTTHMYNLDEGLSLTINVQSRRNRNSGKDSLYFEMRANGGLERGSKLEADRFFDRAHTAIGEMFEKITDAKVQKEFWKPLAER